MPINFAKAKIKTNLAEDDVLDCTFTNTKLGQIRIKPFLDLNRNGTKQGFEPLFQSWVSLESEGESDGSEYEETIHTNQNGVAVFKKLMTGPLMQYEAEIYEYWIYEQSDDTCEDIVLSRARDLCMQTPS